MGPETGIESTGILALRAIISLVGVLAVIGVIGWLLKRFSGGHLSLANTQGPGIAVEVMSAKNIDSRRKLILIRRDDVAHLVLIGGASDVLIESSIEIKNKNGTNALPKEQGQDMHEASA